MQRTYEKWWLNKYVKQLFDDRPPRKVVGIRFIAPPSGIYGDVWLTFEDGKEEPVSTHYTGHCVWGSVFRPRKKDLIVAENVDRS
jgi:hypothetical protein